jgi:TolA-binding protein
VRAVRANSQDTSTRLGELREEIQALRKDVVSLLSRMTFAPPTPVDPLDPNAPPPLTTTLPAPALPSTAGLSPEQVFQTAMGDYAAGQFALAITGFEQFLKEFATSERADDAQQAIGDAEVAQMRFEQAIAAYNRVIQNYPKGDQLPWAYYKRALVQRRLGRTDEARASLEAAIKTAPGAESNVAVLAKQQLDGLARTPAATATPQRP